MSMDDVPNVAEKHLLSLQQESDFLSKIENDLLLNNEISLNEKDNQIIQDKCQDINKDFSSKLEPILSLIHQIEIFLDKKYNNIPNNIETDLRELTSDIKIRTDQLQKEINSRLRSLIMILDECDQFSNRINDCLQFQEKFDKSIEAIIQVESVDKLTGAIVDLKSLENDFGTYQNDIRVLNNTKLKLVDKINKFDENKRKFCKLLLVKEIENTNYKFLEKINHNVEEIMEQHRESYTSYKKNLLLLSNTNDTFESLQQKQIQLNVVLKESNEILDSVAKNSSLSSIDKLHKINGELSALLKTVKDLETMKSQVIPMMESIGIKNNYIEVLAKSIDETILNYSETNDKVKDLLKTVNSQSLSVNEASSSIKNLEHWLTDLNHRLTAVGPLSLDNHVLSTQDRLIRTLLAEIKGRQPGLENLASIVLEYENSKIENLKNKMDQCFSVCTNMLENINSLQSSLENFTDLVKSNCDWMSLIIESLSERQFVSQEEDKIQERLNEIKKTLQLKEQGIQGIKDISTSLLERKNCCDQKYIEHSLDNLFKIKRSLKDLIKSRNEELESRQKYGEKYHNCKEDILKVINGWEHSLSTITPLAVEMSKLEYQNNEIISFCKDWETTKTLIKEFCEVGSKYDVLLQGFQPGTVGVDQSYMVTSPNRRSFKVKAGIHTQSQGATGRAQEPYSGSESSGVSSADYVNLNQELNEVVLEMDDIKSRYSEIGDRFNTRRMDIQSLMKKCKSFESDYEECCHKLDNILKEVFPDDEMLENIDFERIDEDIKMVQPDVERILFSGKDLLRHREFVPGGVELKAKLERMDLKIKSLKDSSKKQIDLQKNIDDQKRKFSEMKKVLENSIMRKRKMISVLGPVGTSVNFANSQLDQVNALFDEIEGLDNDVKELSKVGRDILRSVSPSSSEAEDIESTLNDFNSKVNDLTESLKKRENNINSIIGPSKDFYKLINSINDNLISLQNSIDNCQDSENLVDNNNWGDSQICLNEIKSQLEAVEILSQTLVNSTSDESAHYDIKNKVSNLTRHSREIQSKIDRNITENDRRNVQDDQILSKLEEAQKWIEERENLATMLSVDNNISTNILDENIRQLKTLQGDLRHKKSQISDLKNEMNRINMDKSPTLKSKRIHDTIKGLLPIFDKLEVNIHEACENYQKVSNNSDKINNDVRKMEGWINIEKHKLNRQCPVGIDAFEFEERALEQTIESITKRKQQLADLVNMVKTNDNTDSTVLLAPNLTLINEIESNLTNLESEAEERLGSIKESHDKILTVSENLGDLHNVLVRLDTKWKDMLSNLNNFTNKPYDIGKLEKEVLTIENEIKLMNPELINIKSNISLIAEANSVNAKLLEPEWRKANKQYEALYADIAEKLLLLKSKQKAADDSKDRIKILSTRQKNLKEKIENFPQPCLDLDSLEDQIQDTSALLREVHEIENSIQGFKDDVKNLLEQGCLESANSLSQKLINIKNVNDEIKEMIDDRQNSLRLQHNLVTNFVTKKNELSRNLADVMNGSELNNLASETKKYPKNANEDIRIFIAQRLEPLKRELEQVVKIGNEACSTVITGLGYKHIEQESEQVKQSYDKLMNMVSDIENNVDKKLIKEHKFDSTVNNLKNFLIILKNDVKLEEEPSVEYHKSKSQLNTHRLILDRLKKRRSSFEELNKIGSEILINMDKSKVSDIENEVANLNHDYDTLLNIANEKSSRYEKAVKLAKAFKDLYEPSLAWLDSAEKDLANLDTSPTSDTSEIEKRINKYQDLVRQINSHEKTLTNLDNAAQDLISCSSDNDAMAIRKRVESVHNYFEENKQNAQFKLELFKNSVPIAERFLLANNKLDLVLPSLTALVRETDSISTTMSERNMNIIENEANAVEKLVVQARSDLNQLKQVDTFERSLEKVEDLFVENEKSFREVQDEVIKRVTLMGSNRTKANILEDKLEFCQDFMEKFKNEVQELSGKINNEKSDFEILKFELEEILPTWQGKKEEITSVLNETKKLIRQSPGTDLKTLKAKLDTVTKQCQYISKTFESLQIKLDEIIPLANEFASNYDALHSWLSDIEENMYHNNINNLDPDQLHKAQYEIKDKSRGVMANVWEDQKPLLDKIIKTGQPLLQLVNKLQGKSISEKIEDSKKRYNNIKEFIKTKATDIEDMIQINTELNEKVDQCVNQLDNVRDRVTDCYQPSVHPEKLDEELTIFDEITFDLGKLKDFVLKLQANVQKLSQITQTDDKKNESIELLNKLKNILSSIDDLQNESNQYKENIIQLLDLAKEFWNGIGGIDQKLNEINKEMTTLTPDNFNGDSMNDNNKLISKMKKEVENCEVELDNLTEKGSILMGKVDNPNELPDVEQVEEDIKRNLENVKINFEQLVVNINNQKMLLDKIEKMRLELDTWFEIQNDRLLSLGPLPTETRPVLNQIEQTKELKIEIEPKHREIEQINQLSFQLTKKAHPNITKHVNNTMERINEYWERLLDSVGQRQHQLQCILLSLGEFHRAVDEFMEWIISTEHSLGNIKVEYGDISGLELGLAQQKMIRANMNIQQASINKIERKAAELIKDDVGHLGHEATERLAKLNQHWEALKESLRNKHFELEDALKEALIYHGDYQEVLRNLEDMATKLDKFKFSGGLPDTAKEQLKRFLEIYKTLPALQNKIDRLQEDSNELKGKASSAIRDAMESDIIIVEKKWNAILSQAETRKTRLENAIITVESFHSDMAKFINWLTLTERNLNQQRPVSRIVPIILDQIEAHQAIKRDITSHREELLNLDKVATHLKYLSQKHDIVLIRNLMSSIHHRWEKIVSRSSERSRNLDYGYKEAKRFKEMNKSLLDIIAENLTILEQDTVIGQTSEVIREQIVKHKEFQCRLGVYNLSYDETRRFGYQLRDKAPTQDKVKLDDIVHNLQLKWQNLCNKSVERERTLNDALLLSGNYKDALDNVLSWLRNMEPSLKASSKGYAGDVMTVQMQMANLGNFDKELKLREKMVNKIRNDANQLMMQSEEDTSLIEDQLTDLHLLWTNTNNLAAIKRQNLEAAKTQALEFESQWSSLKDLFAKSEHGLRQFIISPEEDNNEVLSTMIQNSKLFHTELLSNEQRINDFQKLGHEILSNVHPDAEGPIKHYINIIKSQWSELLSWSEQRSRNIEELLAKLCERKILLDDLLLWLATAEGTLVASEHRDLPYSSAEAKFQYEEHERFIADMTQKQKDHDEIVTQSKKKSQLPLSTLEKNRRKEFGSNQNLNKENIFINLKVNQLHGKWKQVWFMILNRRKKLLDHIEYLKQVDNLKHFSFDDWRRKYMSWMNHSKSRVMDLFRRQDTDHDGRITRKEFIDGIIESKFPTTRVEMEVVADVFDNQKSGFIDYQQFLAALRPERESSQVKGVSENELIHDEVKKQVSKCSCENSYKITQCGDGKYRFGENQKLRLVRILRSTVMVRIGGGWCALDEFLVKHDPCRDQRSVDPLSNKGDCKSYDRKEELRTSSARSCHCRKELLTQWLPLNLKQPQPQLQQRRKSLQVPNSPPPRHRRHSQVAVLRRQSLAPVLRPHLPVLDLLRDQEYLRDRPANRAVELLRDHSRQIEILKREII